MCSEIDVFTGHQIKVHFLREELPDRSLGWRARDERLDEGDAPKLVYYTNGEGRNTGFLDRSGIEVIR